MNKIWICLLLLLIIIYHQLFIPGFKVALDSPFTSEETLKSLFDLPRAWSERYSDGLGQNQISTLWAWPYEFLSGVLSRTGLNLYLQQLILYFLPFLVIGILGMKLITKEFSFSKKTGFLISLFYLTNSYIILIIDGGQLRIALAYALFPIAYIFLRKAFNGNIKQIVYSSLLITLLNIFDLRFSFVLGLLFLFDRIYELLLIKDHLNIFLKWFKTSLVLTIILVLLNAYWLIPFLLSYSSSSNTLSFFTQTDFSSFSTLGHSLMLLSPHFFANIYGKVTPLLVQFCLIPILVFSTLFIYPKDKKIAFWIFVAISSIFLSKGNLPPYGEVYPWIYNYVPGFFVFRDPTKFYFLIALSYTILLGFALEKIFSLSERNKYQVIITGLFLTYLLILNWPILSGQMYGILGKPRFVSDYLQLHQIIKKDPEFGRVLWLPSSPPLVYSDPNHPGVESSRLINQRPFAAGAKGSYEKFNFLREAPFMGQILEVSGVKYISYPPLDPIREDTHPDTEKYYDLFLNQLKALPWVTKEPINSQIPLIKTNSHQDRFFITKNSYLVIGSDDILDNSLSENGLIFLDKGIKVSNQVLENSQVLLNNKTTLDFLVSYLYQQKLIYPADYMTQPKSNLWLTNIEDVIKWKEFLSTKYNLVNQDFNYGRDVLIAEGAQKFTINRSLLKDEGVLIARVMESSRSGQVRFSQGEGELNNLELQKDIKPNVRWFEVGKIDKNNDVEVEFNGDINILAALVVLPEGYSEIYSDYISRISNELNKTTMAGPSLSYQRYNSTHYKVSVKNLEKPSLLVFSQIHDPYWKLNDQSSTPVYSFLNGFWINGDGEYEIIYQPQKYILPGLIISAGSIILIIGLLIYLKQKYD